MTKGISAAIIAVIVIAIVGIGLYSFQNSTVKDYGNQEQQTTPSQSQPDQKSETPSYREAFPPSTKYSGPFGCTGKGTVNFTSPPRKLENIELIKPIGLINADSGHVTPTDHGYYYPPNWKPEDNPAEFKDVLAPADGVITTVQLVGGRQGDYRLIIHHTCTFYTIYIHVKELSPKIAKEVGEFSTMTKNTNIPVIGDEVIGRANAFDFSVHDDDVILEGFIVPENYKGESWKIHTVDMFAYFVEPIKSQLLEKNIRQVEPRAGKIDYDIDGRLVGNWFVENTNGYEGTEDNRNKGKYWATHLSFAYDGIDPSLIMVSIGDYNGESKQFAVKGNSPNPAIVSMLDGVVKYELTDYDYKDETGQFWDRRSYAKDLKAVGGSQVQGVVLAQLIEDRKLKFEAFPGKTISNATGFTSSAVIYER